VSYRANNL
jgi:hypothetical protein